jgi:hypothetical protein
VFACLFLNQVAVAVVAVALVLEDFEPVVFDQAGACGVASGRLLLSDVGSPSTLTHWNYGFLTLFPNSTTPQKYLVSVKALLT